MSSSLFTAKFEMKDGRTFEMQCVVRCTPGNTWGAPENCYPDEYNSEEPEYFIEGDPIAYEDLPKGLAAMADAMYDGTDPRFTYHQTEWEGDYDYDYFD